MEIKAGENLDSLKNEKKEQKDSKKQEYKQYKGIQINSQESNSLFQFLHSEENPSIKEQLNRYELNRNKELEDHLKNIVEKIEKCNFDYTNKKTQDKIKAQNIKSNSKYIQVGNSLNMQFQKSLHFNTQSNYGNSEGELLNIGIDRVKIISKSKYNNYWTLKSSNTKKSITFELVLIKGEQNSIYVYNLIKINPKELEEKFISQCPNNNEFDEKFLDDFVRNIGTLLMAI